MTQEQLEKRKSRVLAECERLNGVEDTPHPFIIRFVDTPLMVGYGFFADGRNIFSIQPQVLPNAVNWILASRLLCLPEEGKQQQINLTAIIEQLESCEYRCVAGPLELNTAFIALKAFAESITPFTSPSMVKAKPIEWTEDSMEGIGFNSICGHYAIRYGNGYADAFFSKYVGEDVRKLNPSDGTPDGAKRICQDHRDLVFAELSAIADFTPAPSPQPLVDALKEIVSKYGDGRDLFESAPEMAGIASSALKDWEGKQ